MPSNRLQQSSRYRNIEPRPHDGIIIIEYVPGIVPGAVRVPEGNASAFTATPSASSAANTELSTVTTTSEETLGTGLSAPNTISKSSRILKFLKPTKSFGGVRSATLLIIVFQLLLLSATAITWFFSTRLVNNTGSASSSVTVHGIFVLAVIGQLVFLERWCFRLRGERYSYLHSGEILHRRRGMARGADTGIAFTPWNRPPPPTYAATLAQSRGDVENQLELIAAAPPPAYGDTRGSRLLLQGYSLHAQRLPSVVSEAPSEPISYASRDERWEEIQEADHAWQLNAALSCVGCCRSPSIAL